MDKAESSCFSTDAKEENVYGRKKLPMVTSLPLDPTTKRQNGIKYPILEAYWNLYLLFGKVGMLSYYILSLNIILNKYRMLSIFFSKIAISLFKKGYNFKIDLLGTSIFYIKVLKSIFLLFASKST